MRAGFMSVALGERAVEVGHRQVAVTGMRTVQGVDDVGRDGDGRWAGIPGGSEAVKGCHS